MTIELKIGQLNTSTASDGDLLSYVSANGVVEYRDIVSEIDARISSNVNTVQDNVTAVDNNAWVNANDFATYTTVTGLIDTVQANLTSVIAAAPSTLDTLAEIAAALENDANLAVTLTNQIGTVSDNAATNTTNIDTVQANLYAVTLDTVATNGNSTTQSIEVAGLNASADLTVSGPTELNSNVTINGMIDSVDRIQFNTLISTDTTAGMVAWNDDYGTVSVGLDDSTYVKIGQDVYYYVKAGEALSAGDVLYASGTVGGSGNIEVSKYIANSSIDAKYVVGIATSSIASGEFGYASVIGTIHHINASGSSAGETWLEGDVLYASPTTRGGLTKTLPEAPNPDIPIAFVTSNNASSGALAVRATALGYRLGELHDVYSGVENDGDVLTWVSANARWEPKTTLASSLSASIDLVQDNVDVVGASLDSFGLYANSTFALSNEAVTFADLEVANLVVEGDMTIIGDTTTIESNNVVITNPYLLLNNGISGANTLDAGIVIDRGSSSNVGLIWDEDSDSFTFITTDDGIEQTELTPTGNASIVVGGLKVNNTSIDFSTNLPVDGQPLVYVAANDSFETGTIASSNTQAYVGDTLVSNTALILEAGNGVSLSSNADSGIVTFSTAMGNVTSQVISVDGTANSFTLSKASANSNMLLVFYNGLALDHEEYTVSGTTLTLSNVDPLIASSKLQVRHFDFFDVTGVVESGGGGSYSFQGSNFGYSVGGAYIDTVQKFSFSSDANATDVGELLDIRAVAGGHSSSSSGYVSGGRNNSVFVDSIEKFSFSSTLSASDIGELVQSVNEHGSNSNENFGYSAGGKTPAQTDTIQKFPFASDTSALDIANLVEARYDSSSQNSSVAGYISGGYDGSPPSPFGGRTDSIEKFSFSSDANATDVGNLTSGYHMAAGQSSESHGYNSGGYGTTDTKAILKFSFSSDGNATSIGDIVSFTNQGAGQSSTTAGYITRGSLQKFPFASDANATDIGEMLSPNANSSGHQH